MSSEKRVIPIEPRGPRDTGLTPLELDPGDFQSPLPEQSGHVYFSDEEAGLAVGIWETTTMQEAYGPYPGDEIVMIQEGRFDMVDGAGAVLAPVEEGQTALLHNAAPMSWRQQGYLRKFYMLHTPGDGGARPSAFVTVLDPDAAAEIPAGTARREHVFAVNASGKLTVGLWEIAALDGDMAPHPAHEWVQLLKGEAIVEEADGTIHRFGPGQVFFVPAGTVCRWRVEGTARAFFGRLAVT